jgi:hypothetical protein
MPDSLDVAVQRKRIEELQRHGRGDWANSRFAITGLSNMYPGAAISRNYSSIAHLYHPLVRKCRSS